MVDEKIGPGEMNAKLIQTVKEYTKCDGAVAVEFFFQPLLRRGRFRQLKNSGISRLSLTFRRIPALFP